MHSRLRRAWRALGNSAVTRQSIPHIFGTAVQEQHTKTLEEMLGEAVRAHQIGMLWDVYVHRSYCRAFGAAFTVSVLPNPVRPVRRSVNTSSSRTTLAFRCTMYMFM
ncbi:hypothetical protein NEOLEDRAFT_1127084 [Neolentinus lepideus HHB14362 ss-1]|uniref:Uncharacterized protein n=1 Tax=Neolentinus lepideus HHB14362 ss-1 TaxID=1314782 RepID=A0A165VU10_9AGAM|nr:hypothetical protein NEOLEDRAFT_1127084 [Neolentinus lepideus HHB14362 ss-1]